MHWPTWVKSAVSAAVDKSPSNPLAAAENALRQMRENRGFPVLVEDFLLSSVLNLVHQERHHKNGDLKEETNGREPVKRGEATEEVYRDIYAYHVAGKILGDVQGAELEPLAQAEEAVAAGHQFKADLLRELSTMVGPEQTVREAVSERKLRALFKRLQNPKLQEAAQES